MEVIQENTQLIFSDGYIAAMLFLLIVCCTLPILYFIYFAFKRKISYVSILAALAGYLLFGYYLNGILMKNIVPEAKIGQMSTVLYSIIRALITGLTNTGGIYICLRLLSKRYDSINTPISFGLGYPLYVLIMEGGANAMYRMSMAYTVNREGVQKVLESVEEAERSNLLEQLEEMAASPLADYFYSVGKYAAFFIMGIALSRLLWYSLRGEKRAPSWLFIPAVILFRFFMELPIALYTSRATDNLVLTSVIYCVIALAALAASIIVSNMWDKGERAAAGPVNRRLL